MRIGIDARMYSQSGIGRYLKNLIQNLQKIDHQNEYFVFLRKPELDSLKFTKNFQGVLADFSWYGLEEQIKFPRLLHKHNLDLMHFPHFNVPIFYTGKFVVTIHDLIHQHFNMQRATTHNTLTYKFKQFGYRKIFGNAIKKSAKILTPSNDVKDKLIQEWKVNSKKMVVTYEGVDDNFTTIASKMSTQQRNKILEKFGVRPPYIFYVGNAHPHKNIEGLIKAFLNLRKNFQYLQLVLAGNDHYFWQKIKKEFKQKDIIYTGFVSDAELVALYRNAQVFVLPSFEEGFGIPILESFAMGCPVAAADSGSLKEVAGDAAVYFNPKDLEDMESKIMEVLHSNKLRTQLIQKGQQRLKQFSWKKMAHETLGTYLEAGH